VATGSSTGPCTPSCWCACASTLLVRLRIDPDTRAYVARRTAEGKSRRDAKRCLRRVIARQLFRLLERYNRPGIEILKAA
jgi:hypothetical protein